MGGIARDPVTDVRPSPHSMAASIVHCDDWIVVVDKPSGMPSVPARNPLDPASVVERVRARSQMRYVEAVHRLDRDTSGLLVLARSEEARRILGEAFERRRVRKRYLALVVGNLARDRGTIHLPLAADPTSPPRQRIDPVSGIRATTGWRVLGRTTFANGEPTSLLELEPVTGRSHQLRAHLTWIGHPIVGDPLYGTPHGRMLLHAASIVFPHPRDGQTTGFTSRPAFSLDSRDDTAAIRRLLETWHHEAAGSVGCMADSPTFCQ